MTTNQERKWPAGTADKINEWAESQLGLSLEPWQMELLRQTEVSKPRTLAEMTRDEWKACQWAQADFDGEVILLTKVGPDQVAFLHKSGTPGVRTSSWFHRITPLPDLPRMVWPEEQATEETHVRRFVTDWEDAKPDPQPGEAWLIEYEGKRYEAVYWYSPLYAHWSFVVNREGLYTVESPEATPVSRLVPEVKA